MSDCFSKIEVYNITIQELKRRMNFLKEVLENNDQEQITSRAWYLVSMISHFDEKSG